MESGAAFFVREIRAIRGQFFFRFRLAALCPDPLVFAGNLCVAAIGSLRAKRQTASSQPAGSSVFSRTIIVLSAKFNIRSAASTNPNTNLAGFKLAFCL